MQGEIQKALTTYLRHEVSVTGCGRTDTGVHALDYVLHFNCDRKLITNDLKGINALLPWDIAFHEIERTSDEFHARFDCRSRGYVYHLHGFKDPFLKGRSFHFKQFRDLNRDLVLEASKMLDQQSEFYPFCKTRSDVESYECKNFSNQWTWGEGRLVYNVTANRFLRGMVRLLVGAQLNVGLGLLSLTELQEAMKEQRRLNRDWSVPAHGLYLDHIIY